AEGRIALLSGRQIPAADKLALCRCSFHWLKPVPLKREAATWRRTLLELSRHAHAAQWDFIALHGFPGKPGREKELALLLARIRPVFAQGGLEGAIALKLHRQDDRDIAELQVDRRAGAVLLVQALHDQDDGRGHRIIDAERDGFAEYPDRGLSIGFALSALGAVRVIDDHAIAAAAGEGWKRPAFPAATLLIVEDPNA